MVAFENALIDAIPAIRRYALSMTRSSVAADDLVQETLERGWRKRGLYQPTGTVQSWLFVIMRNVFMDGARKRKSTPTVGADDIAQLAVSSPPAQFHVVRVRQLERKLRSMEPASRNVVLHCAAGQDYETTAGREKVPVGTIKSRLSRARAELRDQDY